MFKSVSLLLLCFSIFGLDSLAAHVSLGASADDDLPIQRDFLWKVNEFLIAPKFRWLDSESRVRSLLFKSERYEGKETEVFAYYSNPDLLTGSETSRKFPAVVLVHGGGGTAFREWVEMWASMGYAAIAMDLSGKNSSGERIANGGPNADHLNIFYRIDTVELKELWPYHSVASVILAHSWILSQPEIDRNHTFINGISWGGYLTSIAASLDNRFRAAVSVYGCGFYDEADRFKLELAKLSTANRDKWMRYFDPSVYLPYSEVKFLFINGNRDLHYNIVPFQKTYSLLSPENRIVCIKPDMKHSHIDGWAPNEIRCFFDNMVSGFAGLPKTSGLKISNSGIYVNYCSPVSFKEARFYYSRDTESTNANRNWLSMPAAFDLKESVISCELPEGGFSFGFFHVTDQRGLVASSELIIR